MSQFNIAFVLTGSVAAYKACDAVSRLVKLGHRVRPVATASALRFVGAATLEGLTGERVLTDLFEPGKALEHIHLGRWADLVVVCPATANTINRLSSGLADDLVGALYLAHDRRKPFLISPAMNPAMWDHPATRESVARLGAWGVRFIPVGEGRTACGDVGDGRLAEPADIVAAVEDALAPPGARRRILVTSGGTSEPVDAVRVLSNSSTGATGALIADRLALAGHEVVLLRAEHSARPSASVLEQTFVSWADLDRELGRLLGGSRFDAIIHCAAVSDFGVDRIEVPGSGSPGEGSPGEGSKLSSDHAPVLHLRLLPKIIDSLRGKSANPALRIVAFKLTRGSSAPDGARAARALLERSGADLVVHNDLDQREGPECFPSTIHFADASPSIRCATRTELAAELARHVIPSPAAALA